MSRIARIECLRVERTIPIKHFPMPLVARIRNGFGRTGALPFEALRVGHPRSGRWRAFELHVMHPTEPVGILQSPNQWVIFLAAGEDPTVIELMDLE